MIQLRFFWLLVTHQVEAFLSNVLLDRGRAVSLKPFGNYEDRIGRWSSNLWSGEEHSATIGVAAKYLS